MKRRTEIHWSNIKLRQLSGCCNLKIVIKGKIFAVCHCSHRFGRHTGKYLIGLCSRSQCSQITELNKDVNSFNLARHLERALPAVSRGHALPAASHGHAPGPPLPRASVARKPPAWLALPFKANELTMSFPTRPEDGTW